MRDLIRQTVLICTTAWMICGVAGCSSKKSAITPQRQVEVFLNALQQDADGLSDPTTRTTIGGEALDRTYWSERDTIQLYWRNTGSSDALNSGQPFSFYQFGATTTLFSTTMEELNAGSYDYYAAYPKPAAISGTQVSYDLPAQQPGTYSTPIPKSQYRGNLDFMLATPLTAQPGLNEESPLTMRFVHQCHVMRIQVPTGRDQWGSPIRKLRVEFPSPVVGRMTMDLTDPTAAPTLTEGSNTVTAVLSKPLTESQEDDVNGNYVWLFLCPGAVNGTVRFTAYDENGYQSESLTIELNKTLEAGKITPVNLTIPQELPVSWIDFSIVGNNLGEDPQSFTVTAPEGATFRNGEATQTFAINSENKYSLAFYNEVDGIAVGDLLSREGVTITYDTPNVLISQQTAVTVQPEGHTSTNLTVPYLYYSDFSWISAEFHINDEHSSANAGSKSGSFPDNPAWTGGRIGGYPGTSVRVSCHREFFVDYDARLDSEPMANIKEGASVKVQVLFDYGMNREESGIGSAKAGQTCHLGYVKDSKIFASGDTDGTFVSEFYIKETDASWTNLPHKDYSYTFEGCDRNTRLTWRTVCDHSNGPNNSTCHLYLDNIRVSITQ